MTTIHDSPAEFAAAVRAERARLALTDPAGETEAIAPLAGVRARQVLLEQADRRERIRVNPERRHDGQPLLDRLGVDLGRRRGVTRCPAHDDRAASLSWRLADDGRELLHCFAGCSFAEILAALG